MILDIILFYTGLLLAIVGSIISIIGVCYNNIYRDHIKAMKVWMFSNVFLMSWAMGNAYGLWNGGLSAVALAILYGIFTVTNIYGLIDSVCDGCKYYKHENCMSEYGNFVTFRQKLYIAIHGCQRYCKDTFS
jgi:hypothetical protein